METYKAILKRRSIRNFKQREIPHKDLRRMINTARLAPSAANLQLLEYLVVTKKVLREQLFPHLKWAGYIAPKGNPKPGCEPMAYIIILINKNKGLHSGVQRDIGAAAENIMLFAQSKDIASCWLGSINRPKIHKLLFIPKYLKIDSIIALGYANMKAKIAVFKNSVKYWLDKKGVLYVPKRPLEEILHWQRFMN